MPRVIYDGAIYHITTRCNNREFKFRDDSIKKFIINQIIEYNKRYDYEIYGYVIMDNHYHLLIKTNKDPIDRIMFNINNVIAKFINAKLNTTGHALEKRYGCTLIETDGQLLSTLRYIHRNPVRANICISPAEYRWSSDYFYRKGINKYINTNFILSILNSNSLYNAINAYLRLLEINVEDVKLLEEPKLVCQSLGIDDNTLNINKSNQFTAYSKLKQKTFDEIKDELKISDEILNKIRCGSKQKGIVSIKIQFIKRAIEEKYYLKEIAEYLNLDPSGIGKLIKKNI